MKFLMLLLFTSTLLAGDSGLYFDPDRNGEGISIHRTNGVLTMFFYTYGALFCDGVIEPVVSPSLPGDDCDFRGQRWFYSSDPINEEDTIVSGTFYITSGFNYPEGLNSEVSILDEVGTYILVRSGSGFLMAVDREDTTVLVVDDPIYNGFYNFSTLLLESTE